MNEKYYNDLFGGKKYGDYLVYGLDKSESKYDYSDYNDILNYYNASIVTEESEEQKAKREAKEKAKKRNNKIDQILGE
jgi:hypothetical protein